MKFHGKVGFMTEAQETSPGIWSDGILEKSPESDPKKL